MEGVGCAVKKSLSISIKDISTEHRKFLSRIRREKQFVRLWQWSLLILIFALWEWAARVNLIDSFITSQPSRIWATLVNLYLNGDLWWHIGLTLAETLAGFLSGTLLGALIAMALWWLPFAARVLDPYLVILNALPKIAMGPILIVWIGNGPSAIVAMALLVSIIVTVISVYTGFIQTDTDKIYLLRAFGATKWKVFTKVVLPSNMANLVSALKINVGLSWVGVIVGEFLVSSGGLGYLIVYGGQVFQLDLVMASVIILCVLAALMYQSVLWMEKAMYRWRSG
jgi:NitT/TauT family transport system permease protein